ncbi:hypothetical protein [Streptomyces sp. NPDC007856]|uniref:hypothetical protein n=1 Tax=Streptomyces sp. NPDC007856 TaxID=3364781 RepID=UPI0036A994F2
MILAQPAADTAGARIRQAVRASVLVAVLLGLFLMHGGPAAAAGGCHGAMQTTDTAVMGSASTPTAAHTHPMHSAPATQAAHPADHVAAAGDKATAPTDKMHSAPATQAAHPADHVKAAGDKATAPTDEMRSAPARQAARGSGRPATTAAKAATPRVDEAMRGALCLATTPRSGIPAPALAAAALVFPAAALLPCARPGSDGTRRRGPPAGGRRLLLQACIART